MLNPFAIEKEILLKTTLFHGLLKDLKTILANKILESAPSCENFSDEVIDECKMYQTSLEQNKKIYVCKICNREFDDGRKLGGHVSRAHKNGSFSLIDEDNYQPIDVSRPTRQSRKRCFLELEQMDIEESETLTKKFKKEEIYEE